MRDDRQHALAGTGQAALQFVGEQQVRQLALAVGGHGCVPAGVPVQVLEVNLPEAVRGAAHVDHARPGCALQQTQEPRGEGEVGQVVHAELGLEALSGAA